MDVFTRNPRVFRGIILLFLLPIFCSGCATYGVIGNRPKYARDIQSDYSFRHTLNPGRSSDLILILTFSGGGTRAAALAYGVMESLRDTSVPLNGVPRRLLDEVDVISSVSGGSFPAAYFGLYGDRLFSDFKTEFLSHDITNELMFKFFSPRRWFSSRGRTEMAVNLFDKLLFKEATFSDLCHREGPLIVINATDMGRGVRFSFLQEYFDLLCSDLSSFSISRAVTASSAVPVLFQPVVLRNYSGCTIQEGSVLADLTAPTVSSSRMSYVVDGLRSFSLKDKRPYIHMVDGGITDNLGLLALHEIVELSGGARLFLNRIDGKPARRFMVISVNASATPFYGLDASNKEPSLEDTISSLTDIPLHRTNASTLELFQKSMKRWTAELDTDEYSVEAYFVLIDFKNIPELDRQDYFNAIPTDFSLTQEQVDKLIAVGRELLENNSEYRDFLMDFNAEMIGIRQTKK